MLPVYFILFNALRIRVFTIPQFKDMSNIIHIDEKWSIPPNASAVTTSSNMKDDLIGIAKVNALL